MIELGNSSGDGTAELHEGTAVLLEAHCELLPQCVRGSALIRVIINKGL